MIERLLVESLHALANVMRDCGEIDRWQICIVLG
jgi:hypothetical protein